MNVQTICNGISAVESKASISHDKFKDILYAVIFADILHGDNQQELDIDKFAVTDLGKELGLQAKIECEPLPEVQQLRVICDALYITFLLYDTDSLKKAKDLYITMPSTRYLGVSGRNDYADSVEAEKTLEELLKLISEVDYSEYFKLEKNICRVLNKYEINIEDDIRSKPYVEIQERTRLLGYFKNDAQDVVRLKNVIHHIDASSYMSYILEGLTLKFIEQFLLIINKVKNRNEVDCVKKLNKLINQLNNEKLPINFNQIDSSSLFSLSTVIREKLNIICSNDKNNSKESLIAILFLIVYFKNNNINCLNEIREVINNG